MKYCNATKISTQQCHNNELQVTSLHEDFEAALEATSKSECYIVEVSDDITVGDSIDGNGKKWQST